VLDDQTILNVPGVISIERRDNQQDLTINDDFGTRLTIPTKSTSTAQATISGGVDYKTYQLTSFKTNNFIFSIITRGPGGDSLPPIVSTVSSPNPSPKGVTVKQIDYLPFSLRYDIMWHDPMGTTAFGIGASGNAWHSGSTKDLQAITGSTESHGHWLIV